MSAHKYYIGMSVLMHVKYFLVGCQKDQYFTSIFFFLLSVVLTQFSHWGQTSCGLNISGQASHDEKIGVNFLWKPCITTVDWCRWSQTDKWCLNDQFSIRFFIFFALECIDFSLVLFCAILDTAYRYTTVQSFGPEINTLIQQGWIKFIKKY